MNNWVKLIITSRQELKSSRGCRAAVTAACRRRKNRSEEERQRRKEL